MRTIAALGFLVVLVIATGVLRTSAQIAKTKPGQSTHTITAMVDGRVQELTYAVEQEGNDLKFTGLTGSVVVTAYTLEELQKAKPGLEPSIKRFLDPHTLFLAVVIPSPNPERSQTSKLFPLKMNPNAFPWERIQTDESRLKEKGELRIRTEPNLLTSVSGSFSVSGENAEFLLGNLLPSDKLVVFIFCVADQQK